MRMLIHLWMVLTLVLGICGDDMVRRAAGDNYEEGSGMNMGSGGLPITGGVDDEDYPSSSSFVSSMSYFESSGDSSYESYGSVEENTNAIVMRGEFTINGIRGGTLEWMEDFADRTSTTFKEFSNLIGPLIRNALENSKKTRSGLLKVEITGFRHGSIITEYEASYSTDSTVSPDQIRKALKEAVTSDRFGGIEIDPKSVALVTAVRPPGLVVTDSPPAPTKAIKDVTQKPVKVTKAPMEPTTQSNKVDGDVIDIDETPEDKIDPNEVGPKPEPTTKEPEDNKHGNGLGQKDNPKPKSKSFWDKLFSHPAILAALVGAVVLALLIVVLLFMFIVYRLKKKDEGSYSLDEPHKVKDPMAYWKDTKEFYA
uniref:Syndecan and SEA domain protein n=1 Tax=Ophiomastix wendtii TaxID=7623 RepID=A0A0K0M974_9ECHI|nr:syndecan and SEA domain protein [Ophiomastix wendtii]